MHVFRLPNINENPSLLLIFRHSPFSNLKVTSQHLGPKLVQTSDGTWGCLAQHLLPPALPSSSFPVHFLLCLLFCPDVSVPLSIHLSAIQTVSQPILSFCLTPPDLHLISTHIRSPQVHGRQWRVLPPVSFFFSFLCIMTTSVPLGRDLSSARNTWDTQINKYQIKSSYKHGFGQ